MSDPIIILLAILAIVIWRSFFSPQHLIVEIYTYLHLFLSCFTFLQFFFPYGLDLFWEIFIYKGNFTKYVFFCFVSHGLLSFPLTNHWAFSTFIPSIINCTLRKSFKFFLVLLHPSFIFVLWNVNYHVVVYLEGLAVPFRC